MINIHKDGKPPSLTKIIFPEKLAVQSPRIQVYWLWQLQEAVEKGADCYLMGRELNTTVFCTTCNEPSKWERPETVSVARERLTLSLVSCLKLYGGAWGQQYSSIGLGSGKSSSAGPSYYRLPLCSSECSSSRSLIVSQLSYSLLNSSPEPDGGCLKMM